MHQMQCSKKLRNEANECSQAHQSKLSGGDGKVKRGLPKMELFKVWMNLGLYPSSTAVDSLVATS